MPAMKLIQSVGIGGANKPDDVKAANNKLDTQPKFALSKVND